MGFWRIRKPSIDSVFKDYYSQAVSVIKSTNWKDSIIADFDLGPLMFVIADYVFFSKGKDRVLASNTIYSEWRKRIREIGTEEAISNKYNNRVDFYGQFINRKEPTMDFWLSPNKPEPDPILNVTGAFCDLLYNPKRVDSYDDYSFLILPITVTMELTQKVFIPLYKVLVNYYQELQSL